MSHDMTDEQFDRLAARFDALTADVREIKGDMVKTSDVFQVVFTVHSFTFALIVGAIIVLNIAPNLS